MRASSFRLLRDVRSYALTFEMRDGVRVK
jgi:hypothetical protein